MSETSTTQTLEQALANNKPTRLPKDRYSLTILESQFKISQSEKKTPFYTFTCEFQNNNPIIVDGEQVDINGIQGVKNLFLTEKAWNRLGILHKAAGLPLNITLQDILQSPNPELYRGRTFNAICQTIEKPQVNDQGQPIIGSDGKQVSYSSLEIGDII